MKDKEIIEKVVDLLSGIEFAKVIPSYDFTDERENFMIVVRHY